MSFRTVNPQSTMEVHEREQKYAWELRKFWALRKPVALRLSERCVTDRLEGVVSFVAVTGAFCTIAGWHVPLVDVESIHLPHFTEDGGDSLPITELAQPVNLTYAQQRRMALVRWMADGFWKHNNLTAREIQERSEHYDHESIEMVRKDLKALEKLRIVRRHGARNATWTLTHDSLKDLAARISGVDQEEA